MRESRIVRILETAPGIGAVRATRLVPMVAKPHRFQTRLQFWRDCGLGIVTRPNSDWVQTADGGWIRARVPQTRRLPRQYNRVLKDIFKGTATLVITQRDKVRSTLATNGSSPAGRSRGSPSSRLRGLATRFED